MAKTYDRISTFLGKSKTRIKHRNDQSIETQIKKEINTFSEKTEFRARVVGIPRIDENSSFTIAESANDIGIDQAAYVRTDDIDDYFLPDPAEYKGDSSDALIDIILAHPVAVISTEAEGSKIKLGDMVLCTFEQNPGNKGLQRGMKIIKVLESLDSDEYAKKIMKKLTNGGLGDLASLFDEGGFRQQGEVNLNPADFAGRYAKASPTVKRFLDDLVKKIKEQNRNDLLPINVGSLYRSVGDQARIMWENVVEGKQATKMGWFNNTYGPTASYKSQVDSATVGTNYGFTGSSSNRSKGKKMRKYMQYEIKLILQQGIDNKITKNIGIARMTEIYSGYKNKYQIVPSRHNLGQAVDIRTINGSRSSIKASEYTKQQKEDLKAIAKSSDYCTFADIESLGKSGEHLHCNAKPEEGGSHGSDI